MTLNNTNTKTLHTYLKTIFQKVLMKRLIIIFFILINSGLMGCITKIRDFEQIDSNSFLVVEATLSNQEGPHRVLVSYSSPSITLNVENKPVIAASVYITDDKGSRTNLTEIVEGIYETNATYKGVVGNSYILHITLSNGKKYESSSEKLLPSPPIDKINYNFVEKANYPTNDGRRLGFDVTLDFKDSPDPNQYYQWKWTHIERTTYCASCTLGYNYSEDKCSTFPNYEDDQKGPETINYPCRTQCFDLSFSSTYNIFSDNLLNGQQIVNYPIARVAYDKRSLYYLKVQQRAISQKLYQYFRSIKEVTQGSGTLFDVPAETQLSPNIHSVDNPDERILGAFEVFGSSEKLIYVDRLIGSDGFNPIPLYVAGRTRPIKVPGGRPSAACIEGKYRTKIEPKGWRE
jgi:Domain of unknown function (DUF4249)